MKSDIQIAQEAKMKNIREIAAGLNLSEDDIDQYGKYKCKISLDVLERRKKRKASISNSYKSNTSRRR